MFCLFFISAWYQVLFSSVVEFYETDAVLTIFVGICSVLGLLLTLACATYSFWACCKRVFKSGQSYNVDIYEARYGKKHDNEGWTYESFALKEFHPQESVTFREEPKRKNTGPKVMITDEDGNLPPYTLRTRGRDGSATSYTTYYNFNCRETSV